MYNVVELNSFKEVHYVEVKEKLSQEDMSDGVEAEKMILTVGISNHAYKRMYGSDNRWVDWQDVEYLISSKANIFFEVSMNEEFVIVNNTRTLAIIGTLIRQKNEIIFEVYTIVRNVFVDENGLEREKQVSIAKRLPRY